MRLLIVTSALLNIIKLKGPYAVEYLKGNYVLTLTPYEVGNGLWKETVLLRRISVEEADGATRLRQPSIQDNALPRAQEPGKRTETGMRAENHLSTQHT